MTELFKAIADEKAKLAQEFEAVRGQLAELDQVTAKLRVEMEHLRGAHMRLEEMEKRYMPMEEPGIIERKEG